MAINGNRKEEDGDVKLSVYMCGYLPGMSPEKSPILSPVLVPIQGGETGGFDSWKDVCGGGCGFALAISGNGKVITWGSTDEESQIFMTSGKHGEIPEAFALPCEASSVVKAAAGWAHCVSATETGEVYTWGWKECVPSVKIIRDSAAWGSFPKGNTGKQNALRTEQVSPNPQEASLTGGKLSNSENKKSGDEIVKKRRIAPAKEELESPTSGDEFFMVSASIVNLGPGVKITNVAAGGRHTLALSDMGQVWGWGYGGEGQLGLGSRIKMVSSPHLIPCIDTSASAKDRPSAVHQGSLNPSAQTSTLLGSSVKDIACGGRHSAIITDTGALLTFGWGLYGQCGLGTTSDQLRPTCVPSLSGVKVRSVAAGLWHTVCVSAEGHVYTFGGNQFGQLGTGIEQAETQPRLLDAPSLENKHVKIVSCGARHSAILTEDGQVYCWGWNKYGQLALGDSIDRNIPSQVPIDGYRPINVACGWWHTLLLADSPLQRASTVND